MEVTEPATLVDESDSVQTLNAGVTSQIEVKETGNQGINSAFLFTVLLYNDYLLTISCSSFRPLPNVVY